MNLTVGRNVSFVNGYNTFNLNSFDNSIAGATTFTRTGVHINYRNLANVANTRLVLPAGQRSFNRQAWC